MSEIANQAIKEWIDPEPGFDINEPMEPVRQVELPAVGAVYRGGSEEETYYVRVVALKPLIERPPPPIDVVVVAVQGTDGEWEEHRISAEVWAELVDTCGLTLDGSTAS